MYYIKIQPNVNIVQQKKGGTALYDLKNIYKKL